MASFLLHTMADSFAVQQHPTDHDRKPRSLSARLHRARNGGRPNGAHQSDTGWSRTATGIAGIGRRFGCIVGECLQRHGATALYLNQREPD